MPQIFVYLSCFLFLSCGYQWGNRSEKLPGDYKEVAIPLFKNKTQEVGAEIYFTNALIEEIARNPKSNVTSQEYAEVVLEGEISNLSLQGEGLASLPNLPTETELNSSYRMDIIVHLRLRRKSDQEVIWTKSFSGQRTFASAKITSFPANSANPIYNYSAVHEKLKVIAQQMMSQAYLSLTESF
tara:strand:+ start:3378 stop:3929 length:552 start_codon:yes stop_codon:yes gene_type:complete